MTEIGRSSGGIFGYNVLDSMSKRIKDLRAGKNDGPLMTSFRRNFSMKGDPIVSLELLPRMQQSRSELIMGLHADTIRLGQQFRPQHQERFEVRSAIVQGSDRKWRYP